MSFWGDIHDGVGVRFSLVLCFLLFFLSLMSQSWFLFGVTVAIFLGSTWETWIWWLPGVSRRDKQEIKLEGAAQRKFKTERPREWLVQAIRYFREAGFFAADRDLSDEALADRIGLVDPTLPHADLLVLQHDTDRVWKWSFPDVVRGEDKVYERVLVEWGRISGGAFAPTDISEVWEGDEGPVTIAFMHERRRAIVQADPELSDGGLVEAVNEIIESSDRQFVAMEISGHKFVICLAPEERRRLIQERGWWFV